MVLNPLTNIQSKDKLEKIPEEYQKFMKKFRKNVLVTFGIRFMPDEDIMNVLVQAMRA